MSVIGPEPAQLIKNVTTAGTAVALSATTLIGYNVTLQAKFGNTDSIFVGASDVDNTSVQLIPGASIVLPGGIDFANWYIDSAQNGEGVVVLYSKSSNNPI